MEEDLKLSRVSVLLQQKRYVDAEKTLKELLAIDPNNLQYNGVLTEVYLQLDKVAEASDLINGVIGLYPDYPYVHYIKSKVSIHQSKYDQAEDSLMDAIRLDPLDPDYYSMYAEIKLIRKKFEKALEYADKALELDAENILALNIRSTALMKLDKVDESFETIEGSLREDPNNARTHANYGWSLLEKGNVKKAQEHFKESLANDPNYEYAQAGLLEAIKAKNPIYKLFLKYAFWMGNLTKKYQWGVIIGFYFGVKLIRNVARNNETLQPYLTPIVIGLAIIAFSTWIINPISNLFLRFNEYGQLLLSKKEKISANFVAVSLATCILGTMAYFTSGNNSFLSVAFFGFAMMVPLSVMFSPSKYKNSLIIYTMIMAVIGFIAIGMSFTTGEFLNALSIVFLFGFIGFQWVANYLMIDEDNL